MNLQKSSAFYYKSLSSMYNTQEIIGFPTNHYISDIFRDPHLWKKMDSDTKYKLIPPMENTLSKQLVNWLFAGVNTYWINGKVVPT